MAGEESDHPRSRGVYSEAAHRRVGAPGSSPLARGLRWLREHDYYLGGIIPARAGFTPHARDAAPPPKDHPRSRGVYPDQRVRALCLWGSSPLARGLPVHLERGLRRLRIIPARAGFTRRRGPRGGSPPDHPRSRGVYSAATSAAAPACGSSPLARGLRPWLGPADTARRIIPARAGFTGTGLSTTSCDRDHPRSRGVYALAAGDGPVGPGIIPARAGFTPRPWCRRRRSGDHPRSRGVYRSWHGVPPTRKGSSPLARGLPRRPMADAFATGIIPARAGFTVCVSADTGPRGDHPRSRGVYDEAIPEGYDGCGSSPLARGLR